MGEYLLVVDVLTIHAILIDEFGGIDDVRDLGALEAAVLRPQTGYYDDPIAEAAALLESLIQTHPFLDGSGQMLSLPTSIGGCTVSSWPGTRWNITVS